MLKRTKSNNSPGVNRISYKYLQNTPNDFKKELTNMFIITLESDFDKIFLIHISV